MRNGYQIDNYVQVLFWQPHEHFHLILAILTKHHFVSWPIWRNQRLNTLL